MSKIALRVTAKRVLALGASALISAMLPHSAPAQDFPTRRVTIVVANVPGGFLDVLARVLQPPLAALWKQPVIVEYKPGAGNAVGTDFTAKAPPDGYTLCIVATPHVLNPAMRRLPYDTVKDLSGITMLGVSSALISASPSFPANTLAEAIDLIRKSPGKYSYASPGTGSSMHLAMELLKQRAGLDLLHVPFKGSGAAYPEVMSGRVELLIDPMFPTLNHVKAGKLKSLALTGSKRAAVVPDIPLVAEVFPGFSVNSLFGLVTSSGVPREIVRKLHEDVTAVLRAPEVRSKMADLGLEPYVSTPEEFDALIKTEIDRWTRFVKAANIPTE